MKAETYLEIRQIVQSIHNKTYRLLNTEKGNRELTELKSADEARGYLERRILTMQAVLIKAAETEEVEG